MSKFGTRLMKPFRRSIVPAAELVGGSAERIDASSPLAEKKLQEARALQEQCAVCPRMCGVARLGGEIGTCRVGSDLKVAGWQLHHDEERPISGSRGSGTIFLTGCSLRCAYCENYPISQEGVGDEITIERLAEIMAELERLGAHNINFVTPTHYAPALIEAIILARKQRLTLPIVWNTSGYERVETLRLLEGLIDIYLTDMRYGTDGPGREFSKAPGYPSVNRAAVREMYRQVGNLQCDDEGVAEKGLLVRHLVLPGGISGSDEVFRFLAEEISPKTHVSLLGQYLPTYRATNHPTLGRPLTEDEYQEARTKLKDAGLDNQNRDRQDR